jgi:hypothetical protein
MDIRPSQTGASGQASGCDFDGILCNIEVHEVWKEGVVGESIDSRSPSIWMLGLEDGLDRLSSLFVDIIRVKDTSFFPLRKISYGAPDVATEDLLMEGFGPLLGRGLPLLGSQVSFHGS